MVIHFFYGGLDYKIREMIYLASGGAFLESSITQAWGLLGKIWFNQETWDLDKGGKGGVEPIYDCVKTFSESSKIKEISKDHHLDADIILHILKDFS